ncbi:MAG: DUF4197 domain-containing protein [Desulfobacterales bacterium]|nr:DUF4197 domain-containing protein [Desulfobacterales bacterium]
MVKNKKRKIFWVFMVLLAIFFIGSCAGLEETVGIAMNVLGSSEGLSESDIVKGLKEALNIGTGNAVTFVSKTNGFYKNSNIKIPLPESVQKVEKALRVVGYGKQVDEFELSMNRAAEKAAPEAKSIFWNAIKDMKFADAGKILKGSDNEATLYFKDKTSDRLGSIFQPIVHNTMSTVGVTRSYQVLESKVDSIPFAKDIASFDLDQYVTGKTLDGLFYMLAEEERKIRKDPAARVTEILKKVFK